ncbi:MAG: DUF3365 domain-containing protein [Oligoflexia bacterium]|nr:DUF3365 domain-containing protein [Oligoflexia bacterium]
MRVLILSLFVISSVYASEKQALGQIKKLGMSLKSELQKGMKKSPIDALKACNIQAPIIQEKVSTSNIKVGRVSLKNRNPNNTPKPWMKSYIQDFHQGKIKKGYVVVSLEGKRKGILKPIKTMPLCLKCHGSDIDPKLAQEIGKRYPSDKAKGYKLGQIRGFFWAEFE